MNLYENQLFHIFNQGNNQRKIFFDHADYICPIIFIGYLASIQLLFRSRNIMSIILLLRIKEEDPNQDTIILDINRKLI